MSNKITFIWKFIFAVTSEIVLFMCFTTNVMAMTVEELDLRRYWAGVHHGDRNHEEITESGLKSPTAALAAKLTNGRNLEFTQRAINSIAQANAQTDSQYVFTGQYHFDNEDLLSGSKLVISQKAKVLASARAGKFNDAHISLGQALHTIQDFYAHTNWIETHGNGINSMLGRVEIPTPAKSASTCTEGSVMATAPLSSGYFNVLQVTGNSQYSTFNLGYPAYKCIHGSSGFSNKVDGPPEHLGAGLNKDNAKRRNFVEAKSSAVAATADFVAMILKELASEGPPKGRDKAICGMTGNSDKVLCPIPNLTIDWIYSTKLTGRCKPGDELRYFSFSEFRVNEAVIVDPELNIYNYYHQFESGVSVFTSSNPAKTTYDFFHNKSSMADITLNGQTITIVEWDARMHNGDYHPCNRIYTSIGTIRPD